MLSTVERVALGVFDRLVLEGVTGDYAAFIAQQTRLAVEQDPGVPELLVVKVTDHAGKPHPCVVRQAPASGVPLFRLDIAGLLAAADRAIAEEQAVDARTGDGTEI